jgi:hypothetical protein
MLCVRWGGGLELEKMVVGESSVMPARLRGQTWTSFPGSVTCTSTPFPAVTPLILSPYCEEFLYPLSIGRHTTTSILTITGIMVQYIPIAVRPAATSSVSYYHHPPVDKQVPSPLRILHLVRVQVKLFCSHVGDALPVQRRRRSCP